MKYDPLKSPSVHSQLAHAPSYWRAGFTPGRYAALEQDQQTDVLVIGAGFTGLTAACELARKGRQVTVIDSHEIGFGCAGRNAGFVLAGSGRLSLSAISRKWGEQTALAMKDEFNAAVDEVRALISEASIDCDLSEGLYYKIAHNVGQARLMQETLAEQQHRFAIEGEFLDRASLDGRIRFSGAHGAVVQPGLALNPLKLVDGYARLAKQLGARIYTQSPALLQERDIAGHQIHTPGGTIRAKTVLYATNAYTPKKFSAMLDGRQFPVQSSVLVTEPLSQQQRQATGLDLPMTMMDTRMMKYYTRVLPDGRVLFGGRGAVTGAQADSPTSRDNLYQALLKSFPDLAGIEVSHFWSGWVSVALDSLPRVFFDTQTRSGYAMGYCGSGVSFASLAGKRLAQRAMNMGAAPRLPVYAGPLPAYPFPSARRLALRALYSWARITES